MNLCSATFMFGRRGDNPRRIFTTMKNPNMKTRATGNSQRREIERLPMSSACLRRLVDRQALVEIERKPGIGILRIEPLEIEGPDIGHATISSICSA